RPWPASGDLLRGVAECRAYPFRGAGLFDVKLEQRRQRRDDWITFAAGAAEESANHSRAPAVAAMMDGCEAAVLGRTDDLAARNRRQAEIAAHQMRIVARQEDDFAGPYS